jgi:hypothetical protein
MVHDFAWAADKNYLHDVVTGPNDVAIHFLYKIIQLLSKTGKVAANDGESNGFYNKMLETILTNNIHSYKVVMAEWSMLCVH